MAVPDPRGVGGLGAFFTFPFVTIEAVALIDSHTIAVMNDNNFPGTGGRSATQWGPSGPVSALHSWSTTLPTFPTTCGGLRMTAARVAQPSARGLAGDGRSHSVQSARASASRAGVRLCG